MAVPVDDHIQVTEDRIPAQPIRTLRRNRPEPHRGQQSGTKNKQSHLGPRVNLV
jgi:hypothetical protein